MGRGRPRRRWSEDITHRMHAHQRHQGWTLSAGMPIEVDRAAVNDATCQGAFAT